MNPLLNFGKPPLGTSCLLASEAKFELLWFAEIVSHLPNSRLGEQESNDSTQGSSYMQLLLKNYFDCLL